MTRLGSSDKQQHYNRGVGVTQVPRVLDLPEGGQNEDGGGTKIRLEGAGNRYVAHLRHCAGCLFPYLYNWLSLSRDEGHSSLIFICLLKFLGVKYPWKRHFKVFF